MPPGLHVPNEVRLETEAYFRDCGRGRHECVVFWAAAIADRKSVVRAIHPRHSATIASTGVDASEIFRINMDLFRRSESIVTQLHTHPSAAFHSGTDDDFPIVNSPGFLSIVLPDFGTNGLQGFVRCSAYEVTDQGAWACLARRELARLVEWTDAPKG